MSFYKKITGPSTPHSTLSRWKPSDMHKYIYIGGSALTDDNKHHHGSHHEADGHHQEELRSGPRTFVLRLEKAAVLVPHSAAEWRLVLTAAGTVTAGAALTVQLHGCLHLKGNIIILILLLTAQSNRRNSCQILPISAISACVLITPLTGVKL